jgi:hypothetical protein
MAMLSSSLGRRSRWLSRATLLAAALALGARNAEAEPVPEFDWSVPARFRVPALPDPGVLSGEATRYFDGPVTPSVWQLDLDACDTTGPATTFAWALDGVPVLTTASCEASLEVPTQGSYEVTLTATDAEGGSASLTRRVRVKDWLVIGVGDSYGSGEGSPDEDVSILQIDALGAARDARAAAESAAAARFAEWLIVQDDLDELIPLVNAVMTRYSAWQAAVAARNDACDNFPPTVVLCAEAQIAATAAAAQLVSALTALGLEGLFGSSTLLGVVSDLLESAQQAVAVAFALLDAAEAAVTAAAQAVAQAVSEIGPRWQDRRCHRSASSGQVKAAESLELADDRTSVTFLHLACSGATVQKGLIGGYEGQEGAGDLPAQIDAAAALAAGRPADALVVSIGGNDVGFSHVIEACMFQQTCFETPAATDPAAMAYITDVCAPLGPLASFCTDYFAGFAPPAESAESIFLGGGTACGGAAGDDEHAEGLDDLPCNYAALQQRIDDVGLFEAGGPARVYLTAYPGITRRESDTPGGPTEPCGFDPAAPAEIRGRNLPGVPIHEILWAESFVVPRLAGAMAEAAARHAWRYVDEHVPAFDGKGYCALDNWIVRLPQSVRAQARAVPLLSTILGSVHPNAAGQEEYGRAISHALLCDFYPGCDPLASTTTTTTPTTSTTTTTIPTECIAPEDCDDGNACTAGETCEGGACVPGVAVDAAGVASTLSGLAELPAECEAKKDRRRAKSILRFVAAAGKKVARSVAAGEPQQGKLLKKAAAKLDRASTRVTTLEGRVSAACHVALTRLVGTGREQSSCLE